jgi:hypothetical protein
MELKFALLADLVSETTEGKLNIIGEFNTLWTSKMPCLWPLCYLVARFEARVTEGTEHTFQYAVSHLNGTEVIARCEEISFKLVAIRPRQPLRGQIFVRLSPLQFREFGMYEFKLWVDRAYKGSVPLFVSRIEQAPG